MANSLAGTVAKSKKKKNKKKGGGGTVKAEETETVNGNHTKQNAEDHDEDAEDEDEDEQTVKDPLRASHAYGELTPANIETRRAIHRPRRRRCRR